MHTVLRSNMVLCLLFGKPTGFEKLHKFPNPHLFHIFVVFM
jgi:hypothetical protein